MTSIVVYSRILYINNKAVNMQVVWVINIKIRKNNYIFGIVILQFSSTSLVFSLLICV